MSRSTSRRPSHFGGLMLVTLVAAACSGGHTSPPPQPWPGFFHPPPKPGHSITRKQCGCRACDPANCCSAEHLENVAATSPECSRSYDFPVECGITVQTCTPRCYQHVWLVAANEGCSASRPLVCCD